MKKKERRRNQLPRMPNGICHSSYLAPVATGRLGGLTKKYLLMTLACYELFLFLVLISETKMKSLHMGTQEMEKTGG